jgi:hypothetical protein
LSFVNSLNALNLLGVEPQNESATYPYIIKIRMRGLKRGSQRSFEKDHTKGQLGKTKQTSQTVVEKKLSQRPLGVSD